MNSERIFEVLGPSCGLGSGTLSHVLRRGAAATVALGLILILPVLLVPGNRQMTIQAENEQPAGTPAWGEASGGLRAALVAVAPNTDEQKPDLAKATAVTQFPHADEVTFLVELKNVSDKPILLQGTRYGDAVSPPWPGKSVSDNFAPLLFDC